MELAPRCPRCVAPVTGGSSAVPEWSCADHGVVSPLWRATAAAYDGFAQFLQWCQPLPAWVRWPIPPGWAISDFGCVALPGRGATADFVSVCGATELDGVVEMTVVTEEPGVGLGARCAELARTDPGADLGDGPPQVKIDLEGHPVALWAVSTSSTDAVFDRSVFAGEAGGRWLWLMLRPASAALLLQDDWSLADVSALGPQLVDVPFREVPRSW